MVTPRSDIVHLFSRNKAALQKDLQGLRNGIQPDGIVRVSLATA